HRGHRLGCHDADLLSSGGGPSFPSSLADQRTAVRSAPMPRVTAEPAVSAISAAVGCLLRGRDWSSESPCAPWSLAGGPSAGRHRLPGLPGAACLPVCCESYPVLAR